VSHARARSLLPSGCALVPPARGRQAQRALCTDGLRWQTAAAAQVSMHPGRPQLRT